MRYDGRMRAIILISLLLAGCYDREHAAQKLREMGRPDPIQCNYLDSRAGTYACTDGEGVSWICSDDNGCMRWGSK